MSTIKQETRRAAKPQQDSPWPHVRLSETDRLETFSDSVLSITKDLHRVIVLKQGDGVGRVHYGQIFGHARPRKRALTSADLLAKF